MSFDAKVITVMLSCPSDVEDEIDWFFQAVREWNSLHANHEEVVFVPVHYSTDAISGVGKYPQELINEHLLGNCDLVIGVFRSRIGTATKDYLSGTVEEIEKHSDKNKPVNLFFYAGEIPRGIDTAQLEALNKYKDKMKTQSLFWEYKDKEGFKSHLSRAFYSYQRRHLEETPNNETVKKNVEANTSHELSKRENELLDIASTGNMLVVRTMSGSCIFVGNGQIAVDDPREIANYEEAIATLLGLGYFSEAYNSKGDLYYKTTASGYRALESFSLSDKSDFVAIDDELESILQEVLDSSSGVISYINRQAELEELTRLGLLDKSRSSMYIDGNMYAELTYAGKTYFKKKEKSISSKAAFLVDKQSAKDKAILEKLIVISSELKGKPITKGFDKTNNEENESIRRLHKRGLLDVRYADNVPWMIEVTPSGYDSVEGI